MSHGFIGMDQKIYTNFTDFIHGLRQAGLVEGETNEGRILRLLHDTSDAMVKRGMGSTVYLRCFKRITPGPRDCLEVVMADGRNFDHTIKIKFHMTQEGLVGEQNIIDKVEELPPYMGHVRDLEWKNGTSALTNYRIFFSATSWRMFEAIQESFRNAPFLGQLRMDINDKEKETTITWMVASKVVGKLTIERIAPTATKEFKGFGNTTRH